MKRSLAIAALSAALIPSFSSAQQIDPDSVRILGAIQVTGSRTATSVGGASAVALKLDSLHLPAMATLAEVMREIPFLHLRTNSRGEAEFVSRGSESRQVAVLLDGIPLTLGWDARADVSVIGVGGADQIAFRRGLSSMLHGPNVLGGVVETSIVSEHTNPQRALQFAGEYDAQGGYSTSGSITMPAALSTGQLVVRAGAGLRDSPGFTLADGIAEPIVTGDDELRLNTDYRGFNGFAALRYRHDNGPWVSLSTSTTRSERGIAAELGSTGPRFWRYPNVDRSIGVVSAGTGFHNTPFGRGDLEVSLGYDVGRTEIVSYTDRTYATEDEFENGDDRTLTLRVLGDHSLGARGDLRAAFTIADIRHDEELPASDLRYRQKLMSLGGETVWRLADRLGPLRALRFTAGAAYDKAQTPETGDKPAAPDVDDWGARVGLTTLASDNVQVHASISRRGRFPALRETFSGALNRFAPNPDLMPEHLTAMEAGATTNIGTAQLQLVAFHHDLDDAIVRITLPDRRFMRVNENELRTTGLELLGSYQFRSLDVSGDVAYQSAEFITPTLKQGHMENQPEVFGNLRARLPIVLGAALSGHAEYTGRQYCLASTGEDVTLDAGTILSGDVSRQWRLPRASSRNTLTNVELRISVDNATDAALYDQCGLPRPGRLVRFQVRLF